MQSMPVAQEVRFWPLDGSRWGPLGQSGSFPVLGQTPFEKVNSLFE